MRGDRPQPGAHPTQPTAVGSAHSDEPDVRDRLKTIPFRGDLVATDLREQRVCALFNLCAVTTRTQLYLRRSVTRLGWGQARRSPPTPQPRATSTRLLRAGGLEVGPSHPPLCSRHATRRERLEQPGCATVSVRAEPLCV